jgi:hypothetical protein
MYVSFVKNTVVFDMSNQDPSHDTSCQQYPQSQDPSSQLSHRPPPLAPEGFSSAFGLMSLEDQNVLAGLSNNAVPFFSNMYSSDPNATPMPTKHHLSGHQRNHTFDGSIPTSLPTPTSREAETRQLREFWETYMRTPLGTSDPNSSLDRCPPSPNGPRRVRVASLPCVKTPTLEGTQPRYPDDHNNNGLSSTNATSSMRTTLHGNGDDLSSYQAAVMARKAFTNLNLVPRKGRGDSSLVNITPRESFVPREGSEKDFLRPSFKRLPSQTLGPANAKRTQLSHSYDDGENEYENEREREQDRGRGRGIGDVDTEGPLRSTGDGNPGNISKMLSGFNTGDAGGVAMDRRRRRMSLPTATTGVPVVPAIAKGVVPN